ncbi:hypothetical protein FRX31_014284 [Thalictrum thalictroides]|uniref:Uncharacterized protein n=1 Tax=Thalictrum thalictroides TaxID=46969 RepID=A0A7J6WFD8_THATH|nr:hypothetical protein FRX31_014284 [Thalictrum thalictroides]
MFCKACGCHTNFHHKILVLDGRVTKVCPGEEGKERSSSSKNKEPVAGKALKSKQTDGKQGGSNSRNNEAELLNQTNKDEVDPPIAKPQSKPNLTTKDGVDRLMTTVLQSMPQVTSQTKAKSLEIGKTMASTRKKIDNQPSQNRKAPLSTCSASKKATRRGSNKATSVVSKAGGGKWKRSQAEKAPYVAEAKKRNAEYNKIMETYYKNLALLENYEDENCFSNDSNSETNNKEMKKMTSIY